MPSSVYLVQPLNERTKGWLEEATGKDALWYNGSLAVEWRYIEKLVSGMIEYNLLPQQDFEILS